MTNTVLITGANRGLGLEFARQYAADGWQVLAACRSPRAAAALQKIAAENPGRVTTLAMDVTDADSVRQAAQQVNSTAVELLINSAGIYGARNQGTGAVDYADWARVLQVNTMGPLRVLEAFTAHLTRSERRLVITITSGMGSLADNTSGGSIPYRTSKAAVNMVMRSAAIDLAERSISCVVINPGWVKTDMGGPGARLSPEHSIAAMRQLIGKLGPQDSGKFFNYDGREYPW
jgi:NAD(P)-dependent dehydrogenase (short-subunit alcohol dehydrogenase family)